MTRPATDRAPPGPALRPAAPRPTAWADIDLAALCHNLETLRRHLPAGKAVWGVVKADAYGHGAGRVGLALQAAGIDGLAVSAPEEGIALRRAGVERPVLVLEPALPDQTAALAAHGLTATVTSPVEAWDLAKAAGRAGWTVPVHVRVNTGFAGHGAPAATLADLLDALRHMRDLRLAGLYTHLSGSYGQGSESGGLDELARFAAAVAQADAAGLTPPSLHALSSPAVEHPAFAAAAWRAGCTAVRCGALLYGIRMVERDTAFPFLPAMTVKARVVRVATLEAGDRLRYGDTEMVKHRMRVAVLPLGFADAPHLRHAAGGGVLLHGRTAPFLGSAFMSGLLADVTAIPDVRPGDEAVLIGRQGEALLPIETVAARSGLRPSAAALLGPRVARCYRTASPGPEATP